jgi:GH24 family phage-related lysozyme (muramidase)
MDLVRRPTIARAPLFYGARVMAGLVHRRAAEATLYLKP